MPSLGTPPRPPPPRLSVLLADDHVLVRDGLKLLVANILGDVDFHEAWDASSLFLRAEALPQPCVALVDLNMPGMNMGTRLTEFALRHPAVPVVVISALSSQDVVRRMLEVQTVFAFVAKSSTTQTMRAALTAAMQRQKLPFLAAAGNQEESGVRLTPRLEEIRSLVRQGLSNKAIAGQLGISEGTVKNYMSDIFKMLRVTNRTQAARYGADGG